MKRTTILLFLMHATAFAQFSDSFSDSNLIHQPKWVGDIHHFSVNSNLELQLKAPSSENESSLATASKAIRNGQWEWLMRMDFNPSSSNFSKVYVLSSSPKLDSSLTGYVVKIGGSKDDLRLFYQDGNQEVLLIDGPDGMVNNGNVIVRVRVMRTNDGEWSLYADSSGNHDFQLQGQAHHSEFTLAQWFGINCNYTSTRRDKFFFDDIMVSGSHFPDTLAPFLNSVKAVSATEIVLSFSETIDSNTGLNPFTYEIMPDISHPGTVNFYNSSHDSIQLILQKTLPLDAIHELLVTGISDTSGNSNDTIIYPFRYYQPSAAIRHDVVISEIMPRPAPSKELPEFEYIELFNASSKSISLENWTLSDASGTSGFPDKMLFPNEYLIVCDTRHASLFQPFGDAIGIVDFPSLNNDEDVLILRDSNEVIIDEIKYQQSWYKNRKNDFAGISLEKINSFNRCPYAQNWAASENHSGGTPGQQNSIASNQIRQHPVKISSIHVLPDHFLRIRLDHEMDTSQRLSSEDFALNKGYAVDSMVFSYPFDHFFLKLTSSVTPLDYIELTHPEFLDCFGNVSPPSIFSFFVPSDGKDNEVVINEVLFHPRTGGSDFVELQNGSDQAVRVTGWKLANLNEHSNEPDNMKEITMNYTELQPGMFMTITSDSLNILFEYPNTPTGHFVELQSMPRYNQDEGTVFLINDQNEIIDQLNYNKNMHFPLLNDVQGVSLERINEKRPSGDPTNWHSASEAAGYATPGYKNSQHVRFPSDKHVLSLDPEAFSPDNDGMNDVMNIHYHMPGPGFVGSIVLYDVYGQPIRNLVNNVSLGESGTFSWDGLNENGEKAEMGIYVVFFRSFSLDGRIINVKKPCSLVHRLN